MTSVIPAVVSEVYIFNMFIQGGIVLVSEMVSEVFRGRNQGLHRMYYHMFVQNVKKESHDILMPHVIALSRINITRANF